MSFTISRVVLSAVLSAAPIFMAGCGAATECDAADQACIEVTDAEFGLRVERREVWSAHSSADRAYIEQLANCEIAYFKAVRDDRRTSFTINDVPRIDDVEGLAVYDASGKMSDPDYPTGFGTSFDLKVKYNCVDNQGKKFRINGFSSMSYDDDLE